MRRNSASFNLYFRVISKNFLIDKSSVKPQVFSVELLTYSNKLLAEKKNSLIFSLRYTKRDVIATVFWPTKKNSVYTKLIRRIQGREMSYI